MESSKSAPTGCYKCGRPGHWSRDCPSSSSSSNPNPNPNSKNHDNNLNSYRSSSTTTFKRSDGGSSGAAAAAKPKKVPRSRPKLTPEILLSDDGLGYVLRHFPRFFKFCGRGHEVRDLGNLIGLYSDWHSKLLPYYSFDQFVHKVEQVAATKRVKTCLRDLRERVANGGDPTKLREPPVEHEDPIDEQGLSTPAEATELERLSPHQGDPSSKDHDTGNLPEDMLGEIYKKATEESSGTLHDNVVPADSIPISERVVNQVPEIGSSSSSEIHLTDEQIARIEANRLKALERAAARARLSA